MSHSKGLFQGSCPGSWQKYGRRRKRSDGRMEQQQKCSRCAKVRWKMVSKCLLFHDFGPWGKTSKGFQQTRSCRRCGHEDKRKAPPCFLFHRGWRKSTREANAMECTACGTTRPIVRPEPGRPELASPDSAGDPQYWRHR